MKRFIAWLDGLILAFMSRYYKNDEQILPSPPPAAPAPVMPPEAPKPVPAAPLPPPANKVPTMPTALRFDAPFHAYHSTRVLCDLLGLSFVQKEVLSACIQQESDYLVNPRPNRNRMPDGTVWSTDWGIVQINDHYNIGPGKPFPSVDYVLANPEACVRWMIGIMKKTSGLAPWSSWKSGAYRQHLLPGSDMRVLAEQAKAFYG